MKKHIFKKMTKRYECQDDKLIELLCAHYNKSVSYTVVMLLYGHVIDDVRERHNYK